MLLYRRLLRTDPLSMSDLNSLITMATTTSPAFIGFVLMDIILRLICLIYMNSSSLAF